MATLAHCNMKFTADTGSGTMRKHRGISWLAMRCSVFLAFMGPATAAEVKFYIREYRVNGAKRLSDLEVGEAVYPFLGPGRTPGDVEAARMALEKSYRDKGFQTVAVIIPLQDPGRGIIRLDVVEGKVGRLRVNGAKWFLPSRIKRELPSLAEGSVPDFKQVEKEIVASNRLADRRITPELKPGMEPGTVDIDLNVDDKLPLHGSLEINNRYSADTSPLRINAALSFGNLFQLGHTLGASFQIAPEHSDDARVYSGYYLARATQKLSLMLTATKQDSNISTLGGMSVAGKGEVFGIRAMVDLPNSRTFHQSFHFSIDRKNFSEDLVIGSDVISSPIEYYPLSAGYSAVWWADKQFTELNTSLNLHLRGMGSDESAYENKRYQSDGNFIYLRGDVSHTREVMGGAQLFGKLQGQIAGQPLINSEQITGGGLGTVRGYLEASALGDNGAFFTAELRSPTLIGTGNTSANPRDEWRFHAFTDAGIVSIYDPLPEQQHTGLTSIGLGSRLKLRDHFNASVDVAMPLIEANHANHGEVRVTFRSWADF